MPPQPSPNPIPRPPRQQRFHAPRKQQPPAARAAAGPHVQHPVGVGDQVQVVVDDDEGGTVLHQVVEHAEQGGDVGRVQADAGLFENERPIDLPPVDVPIRSGSPGSRLLDGYVG